MSCIIATAVVLNPLPEVPLSAKDVNPCRLSGVKGLQEFFILAQNDAAVEDKDTQSLIHSVQKQAGN